MAEPPASRVSVALCAYNGAAFLERQLRSIARQTRPPDEVVACDDASTDDTRAVLDRFAASVPFPVRVNTNDATLGSSANFAQAISTCTGDLIALADQDDVWEPQKLARLGNIFRNDPAVRFVFSDAEVIDDDDRLLNYRLWESIGFGPRSTARFLSAGGLSVLASINVVTGSTLMFRADDRKMILPIPAGWVHDAWIAAVLCALGPGAGAIVPEPLVRYRTHGSQLIGTSRRTLVRQFTTARAMDETYFLEQADLWKALRDRLASWPGAGHDASSLVRIDAKIAHLRRRLMIRRRVRPARWPAVFREWLAGDYAGGSLGWKSALQDALL